MLRAGAYIWGHEWPFGADLCHWRERWGFGPAWCNTGGCAISSGLTIDCCLGDARVGALRRRPGGLSGSSKVFSNACVYCRPGQCWPQRHADWPRTTTNGVQLPEDTCNLIELWSYQGSTAGDGSPATAPPIAVARHILALESFPLVNWMFLDRAEVVRVFSGLAGYRSAATRPLRPSA